MQDFNTILFTSILIGIAVIGLIIFITWHFIESAVYSGTKRALDKVLRDVLVETGDYVYFVDKIVPTNSDNTNSDYYDDSI